MKTILVLLALLAVAFAVPLATTGGSPVPPSTSSAATPSPAAPTPTRTPARTPSATPPAPSASSAATPAAASASSAATPAAPSASSAATPAAASASSAATPAAASASSAATPAAASASSAATPAAVSASATPGAPAASASSAATPAAVSASATPAPPSATGTPVPPSATSSPLPSGASPSASPIPSPTTTPIPARIRGVNNDPNMDDDVYFCISNGDFSTKVTGEQYTLDDKYTTLNGTAIYTIFVANNSDCDYATHGITQNVTQTIDGSFFISYSNSSTTPIFITSEGFDALTITNTTSQVFIAIQYLPPTYTTVNVNFAPVASDVQAKGFTFHFARSVEETFPVNVLSGQTKGGVASGEYNVTFTFDATHSTSMDITLDGNEYLSLVANFDLTVQDTIESFGTNNSSSSSDWLLWLVIGVAAIIVLVVVAVGIVIVFRHFKNRNQYDVIGDTSDGGDDYKFQ